MFNKLKYLFKKKPKKHVRPKETGNIILAQNHGGWGDSINFESTDKGTMFSGINGHSIGRYRVGDVIIQRCESGKLGRFIIVEIRYMLDPKDQFFGKVGCIGYAPEDIKEKGPWINKEFTFLS